MSDQNWDEHPIQPWNIRTEQFFYGAFGKREAEFAARIIVRFCKLMEGWVPFSINDLAKHFPKAVASSEFDPTFLVDNEILFLDGDGHYWVTEGFIDRCYRSGNRPTHS